MEKQYKIQLDTIDMILSEIQQLGNSDDINLYIKELRDKINELYFDEIIKNYYTNISDEKLDETRKSIKNILIEIPDFYEELEE